MASTGFSFSQESEEELKATAEKLFENEQYAEAKTYVERLLALNPRSTDYQYKYGTCLLYSGYKKQDAFKYLSYSVTDPNINVAAYFFLGKAYHLTYQFNEAIKNYELYKQKAGANVNKKFDVNRQIEMCQNGKRLLSTITEIIVLDKKEIKTEDFFRIYDLRNIGGEVVVTAGFQTKIDKKKNYTPLIHFPPNAKEVYYASYGETDNGHKDIYSRKKLPDGSWGLPQLVQGNVNTSYDEDYPYMHPGGEYLYFSSKGHNSMGGYDVFRCKLDPETGKFGPPENIDFAISSTDNDMFYVVDSLDQYACFASARQSTNGKMFVYRVKVDRIPLQIAVIKGDFASSIKPENKKISIVVTDYASGEKVGTFNTDAKGKYLITLPKSGKYQYEIKVDGSSTTHKYLMTVPYSKEFRPLKQHIQEEMLESSEIVKVTDLFNESFDDPLAVLAEVIQQRAELNVNVQNFNLEEIENKGKENEIFADLGLSKDATPQEIQSKVEELVQKQETTANGTQKLTDGARIQANEALTDAEKLQNEAKALVAQSNGVPDKEKYDLLKEAKERMDKADELKAEANLLIHFSDSLGPELAKEKKELGELKELTTAVKASVQSDKTDSIPALLQQQADLLKDVNGNQAKNPIDPVLAEKKEIVQKGNKLDETLTSYKNSLKDKTNELEQLQQELAVAKTKEKPAIESKIGVLQNDTTLLKGEIAVLEKKIEDNRKQEKAIEAELQFLQNVNNVVTTNPPTTDQVKQRVNEVDSKNVRSLDLYIDTQLQQLEKNPQIAGTNGHETDPQEELDKGMSELEAQVNKFNEEEASIDSAPNLTRNERAQLKIDNDKKVLKEINELESDLKEELAKNPNNEKAKTQLARVEQVKTEAEGNIAKNQKIINDSQGSTSAGVTAEKELKTVYPTYAAEKSAIKENDPAKQLESLNQLDEKLLDTVTTELQQVEQQLANDPTNQGLKDRKTALTELKQKTEQNISDRRTAIERMNGGTDVAITPESELKELIPDYQAQQDAVKTNNRRVELEARNEIDEEALFKIASGLNDAKEAATANPNDPKLTAKVKALEKLQTDTKAKIEERKKEIATLPPLADTNVVEVIETSPKEELEKLVPDYEERIAAVPTGDRKEELTARKEIEEQVVKTAKDELGQVNELLAATPEDQTLKNKKDALTELVASKEATIADYEKELTQIAATDSIPETNNTDQLKSEVRPNYQANLDKIERSNLPEDEKADARLKEEEALLTDVESQIAKNEKALAKDPQNTTLKEKTDDLKEFQAIQEAKVEEQKTDAVAIEKAKINPEVLTQDILPEYQLPTEQELATKDEAKQKELAKQEQELREALVKQQNQNEKKLKTGFDPKLVAENRVITELISQSVERENRIGEGGTTEPTAQNQLAERLTPEQKSGLTEKPATVAQADEFIGVLSTLKEELASELDNPDLTDTERKTKEEQLQIVNDRLEVLAETKKDLQATTPELTTTDSGADKRLSELKTEEQRIQEELKTAEGADKRKLEKELKVASTERQQLQDSVTTAEIAAVKETREAKTNTLPEGDPIKEVVTARSTPEENPSATKQEVLQQEQEGLSLVDAATKGNDIVSAFNDDKVVVAQPEEIEKVKRRYSIEIGQIEGELEKLGTSPEDQTKKAELEKQRAVLQAKVEELEQIEQHVADNKIKNDLLSEGLTENVTYEKEIEIRSNPDYPAVLKAQQDLNAVINQQKSVEKEIAALQERYAKEPENRAEIVDELAALNEEMGNLKEEQIAQENKIKAIVDGKSPDALAWQNVVSRELPVVKPAIDTAILAPFVAEGFKIQTPTETNPAPLNKDLPVGVKLPSGLVYRVQVGAFAKPVPEELFKEFTPVTGEKLNNGITRYMAGFFGSRQRVLDAQKQIRALGYTDAFVVAYCDGERINLAEARRLEDLGLCVPRDQDSITMEVVQNVIAQLPKDSLNPTIGKPSPGDYNKAPGAAVAEAVEEKKGLFYTVQVGVYNKPVPGSQLHDINPLVTKRLENGQIRYSSGVFTSVAQAVPKKKEAISLGITDAFITAYYNGERISLEEAKRILAEQGPDVLVKEEPVAVNVAAVENQLNERIEAEKTEKLTEERGKASLVSRDTYVSYPKAELEQLNTVGTFYFDTVSKRIVSASYSSRKALPVVASAMTEFDTVYVGKVEESVQRQSERVEILANGEVSGNLANWLLRGNIPFESMKDTETEAVKISIYASKTANFDVILNQLDVLGVSYKALNELENVE